jgi:hypothetical protein
MYANHRVVACVPRGLCHNHFMRLQLADVFPRSISKRSWKCPDCASRNVMSIPVILVIFGDDLRVMLGDLGFLRCWHRAIDTSSLYLSVSSVSPTMYPHSVPRIPGRALSLLMRMASLGFERTTASRPSCSTPSERVATDLEHSSAARERHTYTYSLSSQTSWARHGGRFVV